MKNSLSIGSIAVGSMAIALTLSPVQQAQAAILQNGGFKPATDTTVGISFGSYSNPDSTVVPNWTSAGYNFLYPNGTAIGGGALPLYGTTFNAPNSDNYYVTADGAYQTGRIFQTLDNLVAGEEYRVTFYQSAGQQNGFSGATTDKWLVNVDGAYVAPVLINGSDVGTAGSFNGGTTFTSTLMSLADKGNVGTQTVPLGSAPIVNGWQKQTMLFTANKRNEVLSFLAVGTPNGQPPFALLSSVSVESTAVPEPLTIMGTLLGLGVSARLRSKLTKKK